MRVNRDYYLNKLIEAREDGLIKIITGIRRCGKSYLMNELFYEYLLSDGVDESHIIKFALDDPLNAKLLDPVQLSEYIRIKVTDNDMYYILLDEVQLVPDFEFVLNGLLYTRNLDIYVTGSNSRFLSTDVITEFRGRGEEIRLYPLSFSEFISVYEGDRYEAWHDYCTYGGLPSVVTTMDTEEKKMNYLRQQQQNVYLNDVIERNKIKDDENLRKLTEVISSAIGSMINPKKLADTFKSTGESNIDSKTVCTYLKYLEEAFIIEKAERYNVKGKRYMSTPYKYYFTDMGIRNVVTNFRQADEETHIMENVIYLELKRRGFQVDVGNVEIRAKEYEYRYKQLEIDFVANKGSNRYYIQSAYRIPGKEKENQERRPLLSVKDSFKKIIVVDEPITRMRTEEGLVLMSIYDFLLDMNSLDY